MAAMRRAQPIIPVGTVIQLPSKRCVEVQGARTGRGVKGVELRCVYTHARLGYALRPGQAGHNTLWLTQKFVLAFGVFE